MSIEDDIKRALARKPVTPPPKSSAGYDKSMRETVAMRSQVKAEFLPLFDHIIVLAKDSHAQGYFKRAGIELRKARKVAGY